MDGQICINDYNSDGEGKLMMCCSHVHTYKVIQYYLNNTCCHAVHTHPYAKTYVFLSSWGLRSSLRLLQVQGEGWCPRRGVCLRPTLRPWCFFQTRLVPEMQTGIGTEPVSCFLTLRIRIRFFFFCKFSKRTQVSLDCTHRTKITHHASIVAPKMQ